MTQVRALAIDSLHRSMKELKDIMVMLPTLSKFIQFLMALLGDPNFKISLSAMQILCDLVTKVGFDIKPYLGYAYACFNFAVIIRSYWPPRETHLSQPLLLAYLSATLDTKVFTSVQGYNARTYQQARG